MRHLFIINPAAGKVKGKAEVLKKQVGDFFRSHPEIPYDIYITKWCRDAVGFTRGYIMSLLKTNLYDSLRVHVMGGPGTLYEVVNGVIGIPGVSVAAYPYGTNYHFLRCFAPEKSGLFASIEKQVFSRTIPIDVFRCGHNIGINSSYIGMEAWADTIGDNMTEKGWPSDFSYAVSAVYSMFGNINPAMPCTLTIDGQRIEGEFLSIMIANGPFYGNYYCPAPHACPNDGLLDIYLVHNNPKRTILKNIRYYLSGRHDKIPSDYLQHHRGKKLIISSDMPMHMCIDGENFVGLTFDYEILPNAVDFVCPDGTRTKNLLMSHNNPKRGEL